MALKSELFSGDAKLEACANRDSAHILQGMFGDHVGKIQTALQTLIPDHIIDQRDLDQKRYGPSTAAAVLDYKTRRKIINFSYQQKSDDIVGKMTIAAMDNELIHRIGPIDPSEMFFPPVWEPIPGFDVRAPDGTVIDLPSRIGRPFGWIDLDGDPTDIFEESDALGHKMYIVVITHGSQGPGPVRKLAPVVAQAIASTAAKSATRNLPKAVGWGLRWGVGKLAGGAVSLIGSILVPSPLGKEVVWTARRADGKFVKYVVVVVNE